jgi:hypothetical protein
MPLFNWIFGHLLVIKEFRDKLPADAGFQCLALTISRAFPQQHMFYLDFWPFTIPLLVVANPYAADQIMKHAWVDKPKNVFDAFWQMSGGPNMITMPEKPWKRWRAIFNPAFGPGYIQELVPSWWTKARSSVRSCGCMRIKAKCSSSRRLRFDWLLMSSEWLACKLEVSKECNESCTDM